MYQTKTAKSGQIQKNVQKQILFPDFPDLSVCCSFLSGICSSLLKFSLGGRAITFTSALKAPRFRFLCFGYNFSNFKGHFLNEKLNF